MKGVILAAGKGERLSSLDLGVPKPMVPLLGKPLLEHTIGLLREHGIDDLYINLHKHAEQISDYFEDGQRFGVRIHYLVEQELSGTAGPLSRWRDELSEGAFVVVYGDVLTDIDLAGLVEFHRASEAVATIAVKRDDYPERCGILSFTPEGRITRFLEKPTRSEVFSSWTNAGIYVLEPAVLEFIADAGEVDFGRDVIPALLRSGSKACAYPISDYLIDVGEPARYAAAENDLQAGRCMTYATR